MERGSIFLVMSMSKPLAATAILMLEEEGRLTLQDPLSRYVPTHEDDRITIRHLLTHTSGYVHWEDGAEGPSMMDFDSLDDWVKAWAAVDPPKPVGEFEYSDFNSAALGYIVEIVSGMPVEEFIRTRILEPLRLDRTYATFTPDVPWADDVNVLYRASGDSPEYRREWEPTEELSWSFYPASIGLLSTAMDYARFVALWMNGGEWEGIRLLSEGTVQRALRVQSDTSAIDGHGYGWFVRSEPRAHGMPFSFYYGGIAGTNAFAYPAANAMVILMSHTWGGNNREAVRNRLGHLEIFDVAGAFDPGFEPVTAHDIQPAALTSAQRRQYVGSYRGRIVPGMPGAEAAPPADYRVWEEDGRLHVHEAWDGDSQLYHLVPLGDHQFLLGHFRGERLEAVNPRYRVRFRVLDGAANGFELVLPSGTAWFSAERRPEER